MDTFILLNLLILLAIVWGYQFIQLMVLSDGDFPGEYDKILWAVAFVFLPPITPFAFLHWKQLYLEVKRRQRGEIEENAP